MTLQEELKELTGRKKRFLLLRIVDMGTEASRQVTGITRGTYNSWVQNKVFQGLYRRLPELRAEYKAEALRMIRRGNQLSAILLEEKIISKLVEEIASGEYDLLKTSLAKEVYSKLMNDLDYQPPVRSLTWVDRMAQLNQFTSPQVTEGGTTDAEFHETDSQQTTKPPEGELQSKGIPSTGETAEESSKEVTE